MGVGWSLGVSEGRERGMGAGELGWGGCRDANAHALRPMLALALS